MRAPKMSPELSIAKGSMPFNPAKRMDYREILRESVWMKTGVPFYDWPEKVKLELNHLCEKRKGKKYPTDKTIVKTIAKMLEER